MLHVSAAPVSGCAHMRGTDAGEHGQYIEFDLYLELMINYYWRAVIYW